MRKRPLVLLHPDAALRGRIGKAIARTHTVSIVEDWCDLRGALRDDALDALVVVDPYLGRAVADGPSPELRALLLDFPSVPVVAVPESREGFFHDLRTLGAWGVTEVISPDEASSSFAITQILLSARGRPLQRLLATEIAALLPPPALPLLHAAVDVACAGGNARDLARTLYFSRRSILRRYRQAGLPAPRRLLAWLRVLLAAEMLDDAGRRVADIAHACGYSSDNALRTALQQFVGEAPTALRRTGAFPLAADRFLGELHALRMTVATEEVRGVVLAD